MRLVKLSMVVHGIGIAFEGFRGYRMKKHISPETSWGSFCSSRATEMPCEGHCGPLCEGVGTMAGLTGKGVPQDVPEQIHLLTPPHLTLTHCTSATQP